VVAGLDDVIDSKRAADRPNEQTAPPYLESLRDESATVEARMYRKKVSASPEITRIGLGDGVGGSTFPAGSRAA
jgi:hypothetical protein